MSFKIKGKKHTLVANYYNDFIYMEIIEDINLLIKDSGYQFRFIANDPQTYFVVVLSDKEKSKIEQERGFSLVTKLFTVISPMNFSNI